MRTGLLVVRSRRAAVLWQVCILLALLAGPASAKERLVRHLGIDDKLLPEKVHAIAQDADGFIWLGTSGGLIRYDGTRLVPWAPDLIRGVVARIATRDGELIAAIWDGQVFRVTAAGTTVVLGPDGQPLIGANDLWFDHAGRLWVPTRDRRVLRFDGTRWSTPLANTGAAHAIRVRAAVQQGARGGTFFALTARALWAVDAGDRATHVADLDGVDPEGNVGQDLLPMPDGSVLVSRWRGTISRYRDGALVEDVQGHGVARAMARRGDVVWVVLDNKLVAIHPGGRREVLTPEESIAHRGDCIFVDREGSLWVGNSRGVFQFPEPDTAAWTVHDGLPDAGSRRLARTPEGLWVLYWSYRLGRIAPAATHPSRATFAPDLPQPRRTEMIEGISLEVACTDARGVLWGAQGTLGSSTRTLMSRRPGEPFVEHFELGGAAGCATGRDGSVWIVAERGVWRTDGGDRPRMVSASPIDGTPRIFEGASGTLWVLGGNRLCEAEVAKLRAGAATLRCHAISFEDSTAVMETPSGAVWLASSRMGVMRWTRGGGLEPLAAVAGLPSTSVHVLEPARDGGLWLGGAGFLVRVEERPDMPDGWRVLERLGPDNGIHAFNPIDVLEDESGTLWATIGFGVLELPRSARDRAPPVITPKVIDLAFDGRKRDGDRELRLDAGANSVTLQLASLSYRDPSSILYRVRVRGDTWSTPVRQPSIQLVDLPAGDYRIEIAASADERTWVTAAATPSFTVVRPWYLRPWAWVMFAAIAALAIYATHRVRAGIARRLERQRLSIAMDLHDDVGSGLGGIGLMAGLTADGAIDEQTRRTAAAQIAQTAKSLGKSLSDIVASLHDDGGTLRELADHLVERASMLFPDDRPRLVLELPERWPDVRLERRIERNLKLIVVEALHNAAKHANASVVVLAARVSREELTFHVEDDGRGTSRDARRKGLGLTSMRRRADRIRARFAIASPPPSRDHGTRVAVVVELVKMRAVESSP